jgi:hypothetical protein
MFPVSSVGPTIAALVMRARRKIAAHFMAQHAISAEEAVGFVPGSLIMKRQFECWQARGVVRQAGPGRYWLDLNAYRADDEARRRRMVPVVVVLVLILVGVMMLFYQG